VTATVDHSCHELSQDSRTPGLPYLHSGNSRRYRCGLQRRQQRRGDDDGGESNWRQLHGPDQYDTDNYGIPFYGSHLDDGGGQLNNHEFTIQCHFRYESNVVWLEFGHRSVQFGNVAG
jgi:hypothetical protein